MTKTDFCEVWAKAIKKSMGIELTPAQAGGMFSLFVETVHTLIKRDGIATVSGLGIFKTKERAARTGRNPKTGDVINIPAKLAVTFKAAAALKRLIGK